MGCPVLCMAGNCLWLDIVSKGTAGHTAPTSLLGMLLRKDPSYFCMKEDLGGTENSQWKASQFTWGQRKDRQVSRLERGRFDSFNKRRLRGTSKWPRTDLNFSKRRIFHHVKSLQDLAAAL